MNQVIAVADAVTAELNESNLLPAIAQRRYRPRRQLEDLHEMQVTVVPKAVTIAGGSRCAQTFDCQIDVAIQQKLGDESAIDPLMNLVQQVIDHLSQKRLADAAFISVTHEPIYSVEHLDEMRVFTSVFTLTYRILR